MKRRTSFKSTVLTGLALFLAVGMVQGADKGKKAENQANQFPPHVVKTVPANLADGVDFTIKEIKVTFDRKMSTDKSWSWMMHQNLGVYPGYRPSPEPRWEDDGKTCVLAVKLSPDTLYAVGANSYRHTGFRDTDGKIAIPYIWVFKTKKAK